MPQTPAAAAVAADTQSHTAGTVPAPPTDAPRPSGSRVNIARADRESSNVTLRDDINAQVAQCLQAVLVWVRAIFDVMSLNRNIGGPKSPPDRDEYLKKVISGAEILWLAQESLFYASRKDKFLIDSLYDAWVITLWE